MAWDWTGLVGDHNGHVLGASQQLAQSRRGDGAAYGVGDGIVGVRDSRDELGLRYPVEIAVRDVDFEALPPISESYLQFDHDAMGAQDIKATLPEGLVRIRRTRFFSQDSLGQLRRWVMKERFRIDASLVSMMVIVLVSSALIVFTLAHEKIPSPVVILKNAFPEKLVSQASVSTREGMDFSLSLAALRDIRTLEIQYLTLVKVDPVYLTSERPQGSLKEVAESIAPIKALMEETENELVPYRILPIEAIHGNLTYEGLLYDFPMVRLYSDSALSGQVYTSFMVLENGTEAVYFEGISDFFLNRLGGFVNVQLPEGAEIRSAIESLRIRRNKDTVSYSSAENAPKGWVPVEETPPFGRVIFTDVKRNDTFSIDFTVETPRRPGGMCAQVIRVVADGEAVETIVNMIR